MWIPNNLFILLLRLKAYTRIPRYIHKFKWTLPLKQDHIEAYNIILGLILLCIEKLDIHHRLLIGSLKSLDNPLMEIINVHLLVYFIKSGLVFPCYYWKCNFINILFLNPLKLINPLNQIFQKEPEPYSAIHRTKIWVPESTRLSFTFTQFVFRGHRVGF